jgi:uncharacterized membrane protein YkvA (DUF1232 family)
MGFPSTNRGAFIAPMKKAKAKSGGSRKTRSPSKNVEKGVPYQQAAIRSEAFAKAILDAKSYAADPDLLRALFDEASSKAASISREPFKDNWAYVQAMLRLIRAYYRGEYRMVERSSLLSIIAAISYFVDPFDLMPDEIPFLGFLDDATVIAFAVERTRQTLDDFMTWETAKP